MRKLLTGTAAVLAMALPGVAAAEVSGYAGAGWVNSDTNLSNDNTDAFGAHGAALFGLGDRFGVEVDGAVLDSEDTDTSWGTAVHFLSRSEKNLFGGYVGYTDNGAFDYEEVGAEAAHYFDKWTLNAAAGYAFVDEDGAENPFGVRVGVSAFASDNVRVDAGVGYANGDTNALNYALGLEFSLGSLPLTLGANWQHTESDKNNADGDVVAATLRFTFGNETLLERDRSGASQAGRTAFGSLFSAN